MRLLRKIVASIIILASALFSIVLVIAITMSMESQSSGLAVLIIVLLALVLLVTFYLVKLLLASPSVRQTERQMDDNRTYQEAGWCAEVKKVNCLAVNSPRVIVQGMVPAMMTISPSNITVSRQGCPDVIFDKGNIKMIDFVAFDFVGTANVLRLSPRQGNSLLFTNESPDTLVADVNRGLKMAAGGSSRSGVMNRALLESFAYMSTTQYNEPTDGVYGVGVMRKRFGRGVTRQGSSSKAVTFGRPMGAILLGMTIATVVVSILFAWIATLDLSDAVSTFIVFLIISFIFLTLAMRQFAAQRFVKALTAAQDSSK